MSKKTLIPDISDAALRDATGRTWEGWTRWIDGRGGRKLTHREIVALLADEGGVESSWWQQAVTNGYEKLAGRRRLGQTQAGGYQIGVQKTFQAPAERVWRVLVSKRGLETWLGPGAPRSLREGRSYTLEDGAKGEVRVLREGERLRLTWQPGAWKKPSTIQLRITAKGPEKCVLGFHQEHLPNQRAREQRRAWFKRAADELDSLV